MLINKNKIIEVYTEERFLKEINILKKALGNHMIILNGGAMFCYIQDLNLKNIRFPTDIDIAVDISLNEVQKLLDKKNILNCYDSNAIKLWEFEYMAPCVKAKINDSKIIILEKSIIKDINDNFFNIDFNKNFYTNTCKKYNIRIAGLEYLKVVKEFQLRPNPKYDVSDLELIEKIIKQNPYLFKESRYLSLKTHCIKNK